MTRNTFTACSRTPRCLSLSSLTSADFASTTRILPDASAATNARRIRGQTARESNAGLRVYQQ